MAKHSSVEYACAAGPGGRAPIPMGQTFRGHVQNGLILNIDEVVSDRTGRVNAYRLLIKTEKGKKISVSTGTRIGEIMSKDERYSFDYRVSKQGKGYCFIGTPTLLSPSTDPSYDQRIQNSQENAFSRLSR